MQTSPGISPGSSPTHLERRLAQLEKEHTIREQVISSLLEDLEDLTDTVHHQNKLLASKDAELAAIARDKQKIAEMKKDIEEMEVVLRKEEVWYCLRKLAEEMDAVDKRSDEDYELRMRIQNYVETVSFLEDWSPSSLVFIFFLTQIKNICRQSTQSQRKSQAATAPQEPRRSTQLRLRFLTQWLLLLGKFF